VELGGIMSDAEELIKDVDLNDDMWDRDNFVETIVTKCICEGNVELGGVMSDEIIKQVGVLSYTLSKAYTEMKKQTRIAANDENKA
jgi:hypothetical protein